MPVTLQICDVPDELHRRLEARAALAGQSLSEYLLGEVRAAAEYPSLDELAERMRRRLMIVLPESPAEAVRAERDGR